jgi:NAD+--asparagine ADP-ribosyltransferase
MKSKQIKKEVQMRGVKTKDDIYTLYKIVDKLEQRISTLEKVLASHAKCIGRLAHEKENVKTWVSSGKGQH